MAAEDGGVPVLSGVAEYTTAGAADFTRGCEDVGIDGLIVPPAMVYKSDPRETLAHRFGRRLGELGFPLRFPVLPRGLDKARTDRIDANAKWRHFAHQCLGSTGHDELTCRIVRQKWGAHLRGE